MARCRCKYRRENIYEIEKELDKETLDNIVKIFGDKIDCDQEAEKGKEYCIFHDPDAWLERPEELRKKIFEKIKKDENNKNSVNLIGYHFPEIFFKNQTFRKNMLFTLAKFHGPINFSDAKFFGNAYFSGIKFSKYAYFINVTFNFADFTRSSFEDAAHFKANENSKDSCLLFYLVYFKRPQHVSIMGWSLSQMSFLMTDVFGTLIVPSSPVDKILDERLFEELNFKNIRGKDKLAIRGLKAHLTDEAVLAEYRNIRKALENNRMFNEASNLFIREMKLLRRKLCFQKNPLELLSHYVYYFISRYGESVERPITLLLMLIFGSSLTLSYLLTGTFEFRYVEAIFAVCFQVRSFSDFDFLTEVPLWIEVLIRLFSIMFLGNLFVALKRRLERR